MNCFAKSLLISVSTNTISGHGAVEANQRRPWIRLLYLVLFAVVFNITELVIFLIAVIQFITHVSTGRTNEKLSRLGRHLGAYARQIIEFMTYYTDTRPYPFGEWPRSRRPTKWPF